MAAMAGGLLAAPLGARAQQAGKVWRIGLLDGGPLPANLTVKGPFRQGLEDLGYVETKALGLTIPPSLLARADQVIE